MGAEPAKYNRRGIFTATYIRLTQEEYEANAESTDAEAQVRGLDAEMPFINLFIVKDGLSPDDAERSIVGAPARYHIRVVDAPDEYDCPDDTDFYLGPESGEMMLMITKE